MASVASSHHGLGRTSTASRSVSQQSSFTAGVEHEVREHFVSLMSKELAAHPELMRGVSWTAVLSRFGGQLRAGPRGGSEAAARAFSQSSQVARLSTFVSHSWHASGAVKTVALLQKQNGNAADIVGVCMAIIAAVLDHMDVLPAWGQALDNTYLNLWSPGGPAEVDVRAWAVVSYCLGRMVALLTWHCFNLKSRKERAFVDKLCIHQGNAELKQQAVRLIGHFLMQTDELLVLLDTTYLQRVWCVFELATFLGLSESGTLVLCPISLFCTNALLPIVMCMGWLSLWVAWVAGLLPWLVFALRDYLSYDQLVLAAIIAPSVFQVCQMSAAMLRKFARTQAEIMERLESFCLADAQCFVESDRKFVESRVRDLYGSVTRFENFAKVEVRAKMQSLLGPSCEVTVLMCFRALAVPTLMINLDIFLMLEEASLSYRLHFFLGGSIYAILFASFLTKLLELVAQFSLRVAPWGNDSLAATVAGLPPAMMVCVVMSNSRLILGEDLMKNAASVAILSLMFAVVWCKSAMASPWWLLGRFKPNNDDWYEARVSV